MLNLPDIIRTIRWMIRDTFRQSLSTKLFWVMLGITLLCTAFAASVRVTGGPEPSDGIAYTLPLDEVQKLGGTETVQKEGVQAKAGEVTIGFGAIRSSLAKSRHDAVKFIQLWLAGLVGDSLGVLLAIIWTAGFLPTFLEPHSATVMLAKPAPRWAILLGKYFGVLGFVTVQAVAFIGGTWTALGFATGVWDPTYWLAVPLLVVNFGIFYAMSAFIAVATRSTVAAAFGTLLFWVVCWAVNYTHHAMLANPVEGLGGASAFLLEVGYWVLPKPLDMGGLFFQSLGAEGYYGEVAELRALKAAGKFYPEASVLASMGLAVVLLGLAMYEFEQTEY